jgi:hypothetical protein
LIKTDLSTLKIHKLTQEQYDRELEAGRIDENAIYLTPDEGIDLSALATKEELAKKADSSDVPTKTSDLTNDSNFATQKSTTIILTSSGWSNGSYNVSIDMVTSNSLVFVAPDPNGHDAYSSAGIRCTQQDEGLLIFVCDVTPEDDIAVNVVVFN